jgi:PEP-CTERM motif
MKKSFVRGALAAGALVASTLVPSVASAATVIFGLTGLTASGNTAGNFATQTLSLGAGQGNVTMRVSAWSLSGTSGTGTMQTSILGIFGSGLGATSSDENGGGNTHTLDNQNRRDFLIFQFDKAVRLDSATFTPFALTGQSADTDFSVAFGTTALASNAALNFNGASYAQFTTLFGGGLTNYTGGTATNTKSLSLVNSYGNIWMVGASFANPDNTLDSFKLSQLQATTAPVPEAATWMMMIAGFGIVGASLRRKRAGIAQLA